MEVDKASEPRWAWVVRGDVLYLDSGSGYYSS